MEEGFEKTKTLFGWEKIVIEEANGAPIEEDKDGNGADEVMGDGF